MLWAGGGKAQRCFSTPGGGLGFGVGAALPALEMTHGKSVWVDRGRDRDPSHPPPPQGVCLLWAGTAQHKPPSGVACFARSGLSLAPGVVALPGRHAARHAGRHLCFGKARVSHPPAIATGLKPNPAARHLPHRSFFFPP